MIEKFDGRGQTFSLPLGISTRIEPRPSAIEDPWSVLGAERPTSPTTWSRTVVLFEPRVEIIAFPTQDTESLRSGRWRVRRDLQQYLDGDLATLTRGARR